MSGRLSSALLVWFVCAAAMNAVAADEPQPAIQPVVLLEERVAEAASVSAAQPAMPRGAAGPALGDWRLLVALGGAFAVLAGFRFFAQRRPQLLPPDVFEVLGVAPLAGGHAVRIVRFGPKTLLVGLSSAGPTTLAEITDPQATAVITAACRGLPRPAIAKPTAAKGPATASAVLAFVLAASACVLDTPLAIAADGDVAAALTPAVTSAATPPHAPAAAAAAATPAEPDATAGLESLLDTTAIEAILPSALAFGVMSLAPAVLLMTTCFVRISVVLALLRQGLGAPQIPSNQILASLAIFLSALVMWPVWTQAWRDGVEPCRAGTLAPAEAFEKGSLPIRRWMATQIEQAGNRDTMLLFLQRHPAGPQRAATYDDVPVEALLPAFLVSELETAFAIGFRLLLPFLVLDILVATLVVSTGLVMLPPTLVSLPLKLLVFVAADGWALVVRSLLDGVRAATG
jgi:flagellar biosynthetic protein FliP